MISCEQKQEPGSSVGLLRLCEDALDALGYELVELEYVRESDGWVLRVFIEHAASVDASRPPITHADCVAASRHLGAVLDVEEPLANAYRLEISSPGIRRPLRKESDFTRFSGQRAKIQMAEPIEGRKNFNGQLIGVVDGAVAVEVDDGQRFSLPIAGIRKARLDVELPMPGRPAKP